MFISVLLFFSCFKVNGEWGDWSTWSTCDVTCGIGNQTKFRECKRSPANKGIWCAWTSETRYCYETPCKQGKGEHFGHLHLHFQIITESCRIHLPHPSPLFTG